MIESNIRAPVSLDILNSLRKSDIILGKPNILSIFFPIRLINSIKRECSCENLYYFFAKVSSQRFNFKSK